MLRTDPTVVGGRALRTKNCSCFMGIFKPITQTAPNIYAVDVIPSDYRSRLQHSHYHDFSLLLYQCTINHTLYAARRVLYRVYPARSSSLVLQIIRYTRDCRGSKQISYHDISYRADNNVAAGSCIFTMIFVIHVVNGHLRSTQTIPKCYMQLFNFNWTFV